MFCYRDATFCIRWCIDVCYVGMLRSAYGLHTSFANDATTANTANAIFANASTYLSISLYLRFYLLSIIYLLLSIYYYSIILLRSTGLYPVYYNGSSAFRILSYPILSIHAFSRTSCNKIRTFLHDSICASSLYLTREPLVLANYVQVPNT